LPRSDYLLVVSMFPVICVFGHLQGVVFGASELGKTARDTLFESFSDELLLKPDIQAHVEDLFERLGEYLVKETYRKDEVVLSKSQETEAPALAMEIHRLVVEQVRGCGIHEIQPPLT
jgi:hypothetical protein